MSWEHEMAAVADSWELLAAAAANHAHACRVIALATTSDVGPKVRSLVLRQCEPDLRSLICYTDIRSDKVSQIRQWPSAELLAYEPSERLQVRARGRLRVVSRGALWRQAWVQLSERQRGEYCRTITATDVDLGADSVARARRNFAVLQLQVKHLDVLQIGRAGHQRVQARWSRGAWLAKWALP